MKESQGSFGMCIGGVKEGLTCKMKTKQKSRRRWFPSVRLRLRKMVMKCTSLGKQMRADEAAESSESSLATRDYSASGYSARAGEAETKGRRTGNIEEAESTLRETGFLNYEEARALLGRLEYQKGNVEGALRVFEGIDIDVVTPNIRISLARRCGSRRCNLQSNGDTPPMSIHAISLLLEAIFLKAKSLQALGRFQEAAQSCQLVLDTVEFAIPDGLNERFSSNSKLQETLDRAVELLPELQKLSGVPQEAISSYRRALLYNWNLNLETQTRIMKEFAVFLLYSGIEANPLKLRFQPEGAFIPKNNTEEAILLLFLLLNKFLHGLIEWDPTIIHHLSFALSISGDLGTLARLLEQLPADVMDRREKYSTVALCYHGEGEDPVALHLLRNLLKDRENQNINCIQELLLASKICSEDTNCSEDGVNYANSAINMLLDGGQCEQVMSKANCFVGISTLARSRSVFSDPCNRTLMQSEALKALQNAEKLSEGSDPDVVYHLCLEYAEQRKLDTAVSYVKKLLRLEAGSSIRGWILLARILSGQKKYRDAETVIDAGLEQTGKWDRAELLRTKAKIQIAEGEMENAVRTYTHILAILQVRKKGPGIGKKLLNRRDQDRAMEIEIWHDLAKIYTRLSQWQDAEACLAKSSLLGPPSASDCHSRGLLYQAKGLDEEAQKCFWEALDKDPTHVPSLISMANTLMQQQAGEQQLYVARSLVRRAICLDSTNHSAWYTLGLLFKLDPFGSSVAEAAECFEASALLEETAPVEPFR